MDTVSEEKSPLQSQNSSNLDDKELGKVLVDIIEESTGQNEINKNSNNSQESYIHSCDVDPGSGRLRGKFISDKVFNLSKKSFSEA